MAYWTGTTALSSDDIYINPTTHALGIQVDPQVALHVAAIAGSTLTDVTVGSATLTAESLPSAPSGSITQIAMPSAGSGGS